MQIRQFFVSRLSLYLSTTSVFHCTDKLYVLTLMSQLDLWLENPPKNFFALRVQQNSVCGGELFAAPLFMSIKSISLRLNILDLSKHAPQLTLRLAHKNIRMAALVDVALKCFLSGRVCHKNRRKKPTGFTFMFINTRCLLNTLERLLNAH